MKDDLAAMLIIVSKFLDYPDSALFKDCASLEKSLKGMFTSKEMELEVIQRLKLLYKYNLKDLQELYVETFDYKDRTGLYLTAQELGDSRRRGGALIQLQKLISELGFEVTSKELADYIPMLLELLASAPAHKEVKRLERRLAYSIHRIHKHLPSGNPYHQVLGLLMTFAFEAPDSDEIALLENEREEADLDPLPYPVMYQ